MGKVIYQLNDKSFEDYGVHVSASPGIGDIPKRKAINSYNWAEYHGMTADLQNMMYDVREFELQCWIKGENWQDLYNNFLNLIRDEFAKGGTQRLLVLPLGHKALCFEVYIQDSIKLNKTFHDGEMAATFSIKMIEPNPVKKILYLSDETDVFNLSFDSKKEVEISFGDGTRMFASGNVTIERDYTKDFMESSGYSIVEPVLENEEYLEITTTSSDEQLYQFSTSAIIPSGTEANLYIVGRNKITEQYEVIGESGFYLGNDNSVEFKVYSNVALSDYGKFIFKIQDQTDNVIAGLTLNDVRIELVENGGYWYDMSGKDKYIVLAGDIDKIRNLTTNAEILWTKL